ncbi:histone acetylation protein-domain-containing protein [Podospora australis]|uniref:histone acetyltransferase n=1 Tax=Podospora australis TaxID=1536484 RepID=A0AAN7AFW7_9PEZI|nr:histone acetylation protein-domain-containing protein [Podospora australis]
MTSSSIGSLALKRAFKSATPPATSSSSSETLRDRLALVLPQGFKFGVYHLSTPPTKTEPLCSAPPGERPDKTFGESHFLAISIDPETNAAPSLKRTSPGADEAKGSSEPRKWVLVFAVEIFIFTTAYSTTLFVAKADSTGYLHLLKLPKGTPSPIREVCGAFVAYLLEHRRRKNTQTIVNLFARAQSQYLFPGSVENDGKHVLDDRGLVKWWCKVLNPLMEGLAKKSWGTPKGYLLVPGLEVGSTRAFIPKTLASADNWVIGHPLEKISHYTDEFDWVPPRCLIPRYPDDPKSRFRDELDEEISKRKKDVWKWASVRDLEQFWEMMSFRQECSSGRLTGFIWLVFDAKKKHAATQPPPTLTLSSPFNGAPISSQNPPSTPPRRRVDVLAQTPRSNKGSPLKHDLEPATPTPDQPIRQKRKDKKKKKKLTGVIIPRQPKVKRQLRNYLLERPTSTPCYYWPVEGRGDRVVEESEYKRDIELLLHLDFSTLDKAVSSSRRWIAQAGAGTGADRWGAVVMGKARIRENIFAAGATSQRGTVAPAANNLTGLVRRKPGSSQESSQDQPPVSVSNGLEERPVNVLGDGLIRKKKKEPEEQKA